MKTERRHQLETNTLAEKLAEALERSRPYWNAIIGGVAAVVLISLTYYFLSSRAKSQAAEGWNRLLNVTQSGADVEGQLELLIEDFEGTHAGDWARLRLADLQLSQGVEELFRDRAAANESLRKAVENYERVAETARGDLLQQRAWWGLAQAHECLNELDDARRYYERLREAYPDSALAELAEERLAALERHSVKEFYDWFAQQQTSSPSTGLGGSSDLESLPNEPPPTTPSGDIQFDTSGSLLDGNDDALPVTPPAEPNTDDDKP